MADGAPRFFGKKRSLMAESEDQDPRFSNKAAATLSGRNSKRRPKIAFTGEEYGFGYQAAGRFIERARKQGGVADGGASRRNVRQERDVDADATDNRQFDYNATITQPLRTKEQALMAVNAKTADFALIPFYNPYAGYDFESLRALGSLFTVLGVEQVEASDGLCLAAHESQLYDIIQSSHPGTGFSALQRRLRKSWGLLDTASGNAPTDGYQPEMPRAGLPIDMADQKLIRDRIDVVFAGPEAARRCKSKLDGLRALGVEVQETAQSVEPHRELAKLARSTTNTSRQTNTMFDPISGETRFYSTLGAESQSGKLFGMVLPYEVAMRSTDYVIIDHDFDDSTPEKTRFMAVENNPDASLFEDKYRTTDAKTRYWNQRLNTVANGDSSIGEGFMQMLGLSAATLSFILITLGLYGVTNIAELLGVASFNWLPSLTAQGSIIAGGAIALLAFVLLSVQSRGENGVRVMFRFRRDGTAASIGDVENYLRNYGVRHAVVRLGEDSEKDAPASIVLDVEFDPEDFSYGPFALLSRRLRGSVVNGALKKAFSRWKNRGVTILAAMPFEPGQSQLPQHKARRWWSDAVGARAADFVETMFIRFSRILFFYVLPALLVWVFVWKIIFNG